MKERRAKRQKACRLTKVLKEKKITQGQLAEFVDVGDNTVNQWARGLNVPNALVLNDVCDALNCNLEDIYPR